MTATGPSIRGVCRILNQNSCGSGSIVGIEQDGHAYIMTNAHVAGSRLGRVVQVEVESTGDKIQARVVAAGYSSRTWTDWALLKTEQPYDRVKPVRMSKNMPSGSHYTKGFPRCQPFSGSDIRTLRITNQGVWTWKPNAIGGQSGSAVWDDDDGHQYGLLTWSIGSDGAGQTTNQIYKQATQFTLAAAPRVDGMKPMDDYDMTGLDTDGLDDPVVEDGLFVQRSVNIATLPIWAEDDIGGDDGDGGDDDGDVSNLAMRKIRIESIRSQVEALETEARKLAGIESPASGPKDDPNTDNGLIFGL